MITPVDKMFTSIPLVKTKYVTKPNIMEIDQYMHFRLYREGLPNHILKDVDIQFNYREGNDKLKELIKSTMKSNTFFKT